MDEKMNREENENDFTEKSETSVNMKVVQDSDWGIANLFIFKIILFIYLLLAVLGLCCCTDFSPIAASGNYSLVGGFSLLWLLLLWNTTVVATLGLLSTSSIVCGA